MLSSAGALPPKEFVPFLDLTRKKESQAKIDAINNQFIDKTTAYLSKLDLKEIESVKLSNDPKQSEIEKSKEIENFNRHLKDLESLKDSAKNGKAVYYFSRWIDNILWMFDASSAGFGYLYKKYKGKIPDFTEPKEKTDPVAGEETTSVKPKKRGSPQSLPTERP